MPFSNCHLLQFAIENNAVVPLRTHAFEIKTSDRYGIETIFWGVKATPFGICRHPKATHWGIVDATDADNPQLISYDEFEMTTTKVRKVYKVRGFYVIVRNFPKYFKITASEYSSTKELKQSIQDNKE